MVVRRTFCPGPNGTFTLALSGPLSPAGVPVSVDSTRTTSTVVPLSPSDAIANAAAGVMTTSESASNQLQSLTTSTTPVRVSPLPAAMPVPSPTTPSPRSASTRLITASNQSSSSSSSKGGISSSNSRSDRNSNNSDDNNQSNHQGNHSVSTHSTSRRLRSREAFRRVLEKKQRLLQQQQQQQRQQQPSPSQVHKEYDDSSKMKMITDYKNSGVRIENEGEEEEREAGGGSVSPPTPPSVLGSSRNSFISIPAMDHPHTSTAAAAAATTNSSCRSASTTGTPSRTVRTCNKKPVVITVSSNHADGCSDHDGDDGDSTSLYDDDDDDDDNIDDLEETTLPFGYVELICAAFGSTSGDDGDDHHRTSRRHRHRRVDLYTDVLRISPSASDREIRIAYFKRGREILGEKGFAAAAAVGSGGSRARADGSINDNDTGRDPLLDEDTQMKFQAISMAYEILSTPGWREEFDIIQRQLQRWQRKRQQSDSVRYYHESTNTTSSESPIPTETDSNREQQRLPQPQTLRQFIAQRKSKARTTETPPETVSVVTGHVAPVRRPVAACSITFLDSATSRAAAPSSPIISTIYDDDADAENVSATAQLLRRSSFDSDCCESIQSCSVAQNGEGEDHNAARNKNAVRWKDYVEEVVFDNHPNEHRMSDDDESIGEENEHLGESGADHDSTSMRSTASFRVSDEAYNESSQSYSSSKKRKKQRKRVLIESQELEAHLMQMDSEAEHHFKADFWDNFEESLDGILSMVDSLGNPVSPRRMSARRRGRASPSVASSIVSTEKASDIQPMASSVAPCNREPGDFVGSENRMRERGARSSQMMSTDAPHQSTYLESTHSCEDAKHATHDIATPNVVSDQVEVSESESGTVDSTEDFSLDSVNLSDFENPFKGDGNIPRIKGLEYVSVRRRQSVSKVKKVHREATVLDETEDIFADLDQFQTYDVATIPLRMSGAAVDRGLGLASSFSDCLSDLSESAFFKSMPDKARNVTPINNTADNATSNASNFRSDATVTTVASAAESNFFDHFMAYVTALLTECEVDSFRGSNFHNDLIGLFSNSKAANFEARDNETATVETMESRTSNNLELVSAEC